MSFALYIMCITHILNPSSFTDFPLDGVRRREGGQATVELWRDQRLPSENPDRSGTVLKIAQPRGGRNRKEKPMNEPIDWPGRKPGAWPWDHWENAAKERGMERTLASLGRDVIRDADQHNWSEPLRELCAGGNLLELLTRSPYLGRRLCEILLETDGLRVAYREEKGRESEILRLPGFGGEY